MRPARGRAQGRSRPNQEGAPRPGAPQGQQRGPPQGQQRGPPQGAPRPGTVWGNAPPRVEAAPPQAQAAMQGAWGVQRPPPASHGRAQHRPAATSATPGPAAELVSVVSGSGDCTVAGAHTGRGAFRGGRSIPENVFVSKPIHVTSKKGVVGQRVILQSNYFELKRTPDWCLYQYRVDFAPDDDHTGNRRRLLRTAIKALDLSGYIFDGTVMYTTRRIEPNPLELFVDPLSGTGDKIMVTIRLVGDVNQGDYHYIQIFNIIIRKCMSYLKLQLVGRNFFDPGAKIVIPNYNLELWPGYVTSIRQHEQNILMCCEITHKVMRNETVYDLLMALSQESGSGRDFKQRFRDQIAGSIVLTDYNNRTYRIDDVDFESSPASLFQKKDGTSISYRDYYRQKYGINITQPKQPMLISNAKPRDIRAGMAEQVFLVPELCRMTGITDAQRTNMALMRALADHTRVGPEQRILKLHAFSRRLTSQPEIVKELKQYDLELANKIVEFAGRVLPVERLFGSPQGGNEYSAGPDVEWTKEVRAKKMFQDVPLKKWHVIYISRCKNSAYNFVQLVKRAANGLKWQVQDPSSFEIKDDRINTYLQAIETVYKQNPELIMCVVSNNKADRYNAIKKKCCVDLPIPTQIIQARNLDAKGAMSIATKVAIQMNCKLGGAPWTVHMPLKNIMVIGYDVCHDPSDKNRSFGATVASLDAQITRYYSCISAHTSGEELSNNFGLNILKSVKEYQKLNGMLPERILIYRDGVGDGQIQYVAQHEVDVVLKRLQEYYDQQPVKLGFIVVSKRINTRFFAGTKNPTPGTVVDDTVTLSERYDFFIVSQCTKQGTASPTSYNVLHDSFGLPADKLQILTYKFTHMYYNWSGTVRVPAPCQYAHKLAFLVSQSLKRSPNPALEKLLYYL